MPHERSCNTGSFRAQAKLPTVPPRPLSWVESASGWSARNLRSVAHQIVGSAVATAAEVGADLDLVANKTRLRSDSRLDAPAHLVGPQAGQATDAGPPAKAHTLLASDLHCRRGFAMARRWSHRVDGDKHARFHKAHFATSPRSGRHGLHRTIGSCRTE